MYRLHPYIIALTIFLYHIVDTHLKSFLRYYQLLTLCAPYCLQLPLATQTTSFDIISTYTYFKLLEIPVFWLLCSISYCIINRYGQSLNTRYCTNISC